MNTLRVEIELPPEVLSLSGVSRESLGKHAREWIVLELYREGRISSGKAAEILGLSKGQFIDVLNRLDIVYLDASPSELAEEVSWAEKAREDAR